MSSIKTDLTWADLSSADLTGANLHGALCTDQRRCVANSIGGCLQVGSVMRCWAKHTKYRIDQNNVLMYR